MSEYKPTTYNSIQVVKCYTNSRVLNRMSPKQQITFEAARVTKFGNISATLVVYSLTERTHLGYVHHPVYSISY